MLDQLAAALRQKPQNHWKLFRRHQPGRLAQENTSHSADHVTLSPLQLNQRSSRRVIDAKTPFRPISALGPRYLSLFAQIYHTAQEQQSLESRIDAKTGERLLSQAALDGIHCKLQRVSTDKRIDFSEAIDEWTIRITEANRVAELLENDLNELAAELETKRQEWKTLWGRVYQNAQEYFDHCLDVNFEPPWSLNHDECLLLGPIVDTSRLLQQREDELREIRYKQVTKRWSDDARSDVQIGEIDELARVVELGRKNQHKMETEWVADMADFLRRAGKLPLAGEGIETETPQISNDDEITFPQRPRTGTASDPHGISVWSRGAAGQVPIAAESVEQREQHDSLESTSGVQVHDKDEEDEIDEIQDDDGDEEASTQSDDLDWYRTWRDALERRQNNLNEMSQLMKKQEAEHFLTFAKSTPARYQIYTKRWLLDFTDEVKEAESELLAAEERLNELGIGIPQTPEPLDHRPLGGNRGDDDANNVEEVARDGPELEDPGILEQKETRRRRRINRERFRTHRHARDSSLSRAATPPSSSKRLGMLRDHSNPDVVTDSEVASSRKKRKRKDYFAHQDRLLDEFQQEPEGKRPRYGRGSSSVEDDDA